MTATPNIGLERLISGEENQEVVANEDFNILDALTMGGVLDKDLDTPPSSPTNGDRYIVAALAMTFVSITPGTKTFKVSGNYESRFAAGDLFEVRDNTGGNDGTYSVVSATDNGGDTDIVVNETIPSSASDGAAYHVSGLWNDGSALHENDVAAYYDGWIFITPKDGFAVKVVDENAWYSWEESTSEWIIGVPLPVVTDATLPAVGRPGRIFINSDHYTNPQILHIDAGDSQYRDSNGDPI